MKLKKEFITHNTADEAMLVPVGGAEFSGIVRGNRTLGVILELLKDDTTEDAVVEAMSQRFDASRELIAGDVARALEELRGIGAIEE